MAKSTLVIKASGEKEPFSFEKLRNSLNRAGAETGLANEIIDELKPELYDGISTRKIYKIAFRLLARHRSGMAARYSLKRAIMELGPTGFPFEHFIASLLEQMGFTTEVGQILQGKCVQHEVDVIAEGNKIQYFVECKFYNSQGKYADVKVPLYIRSRFEDIVFIRKDLPVYRDYTFHGWLVTNTRFTSDAMDYGRCAGLHLVSWDYPRGQSLKDMIEKEKLFPITVLTTLTKDQKQKLFGDGIVLCRHISENPKLLEKLDFKENKRQKVIEELEELGFAE